MTDTATEQPVPGQDPQVTQEPAAPAAPPVAAPAAPPTDAPWSTQLNDVFADEATRGQVDSFIRDTVQPYTTKLEQQVAEARNATQLYEQLNEDPINTYLALTKEMYGDDVAQDVLGTIQQRLEAQQQAPPAPAPGQAPSVPPAADPRVEDALAWVERQRAEAAYSDTLFSIKADPQYADVDIDLIHPFIAAAEGNVPAAVDLYRQTQSGWTAKNAPPPPDPEVPPAVLDSSGQTTPPVQPKDQSLDEAIEELAASMRPVDPPPVA